MSESTSPRRQPPSPLVFSPETALSSSSKTATNSSNNSNNNGHGSRSGSGSNTVSMPFVRRHVTRRLKAAKAECDKELQRVTNNITVFFEERIRDAEYEREAERELLARERERERDRYSDRDSPYGDEHITQLREAFVIQPGEYRSAYPDDAVSEGGYEAELEGSQHSRQPSTSSPHPGQLRRQNTMPRDRSGSNAGSQFGSPVIAPANLNNDTSPRRQGTATATSNNWSGSGLSSRRLSRSIHIPMRTTPSGQSSRSTSRSRSPLPPPTSHSSFSDYNNMGPPSTTSNRRSSRLFLDEQVDPIMTALYDIISVATDVLDTSITQLTNQPKFCEQVVQRLQKIGRTWDEHPDWHGRTWYVQVLLAVASLSRVVEWWEAEKQFWNFDDNEEEQDEPLLFVTKPVEHQLTVPQTPSRSYTRAGSEGPVGDSGSPGFITPDSRLKLHKTRSVGRKSRDDMPKDQFSLTPFSRELMPQSPMPKYEQAESARVLATERLRLQAETTQNQNIVLELGLDGDHIQWVNYAWAIVVGTDPEDVIGTRISRLLLPSDWGVFRDATRRLQKDDSHTFEVCFRLQVEPEEDREPSPSGVLYQQMEGQGMLMIDREVGQPSHTMWVVRPISVPHYEYPSPSIMQDPSMDPGFESPSVKPKFDDNADPSTTLPFCHPISTENILCRICECQIPQWYFEKHSETCVEVHRLEAEIMECNESITELRNTIRDLCINMDRSSPVVTPEYRGMPIFSPSTSPNIPSPLQLFRSSKLQRVSVKRLQRILLEQLEDTLLVALEVAIPSLKDEESNEPIERQRLLSPSSERKMSQIRNWSKPNTEDAALAQLCEDAERVMRQKIDNVVRMQNTIRYMEKIWHEWESKVNAYLAELRESEGAEDGSEEAPVGSEGDHSSTTSEYAFQGETPSTAEPTPVGHASPAMSAVSDSRVTRSTPESTIVVAPTPAAPPAQAVWHTMTTMQIQQTRSSTPSSLSSPLAYAAPIVARSPGDTPPPMSLDDPHIPGTVKPRKSSGNLLEPRVMVTPPLSPLMSPKDAATVRKDRRHSTANPGMSPVVLSSSGPLSPRHSAAIPAPRSSPTSIKDFDIIKPISKGAFGSVFLAKKKATGDYYAIKVLKKADMIAKNQITNVKAERMILMKQAESPFVAKLYFTFQSKENLYLVMEYLNGGDCAALIKSLGSLPEEWTKNYIAEVTLGLEYLHDRGVVHRDLKPDNLLIDQHGHLKLTDFGLSRIGLLGRQNREPLAGSRPVSSSRSRSRPPSMDSAFLASPLNPSDLLSGGSYFTPKTNMVSRYGTAPYAASTDDADEYSGTESHTGLHPPRKLTSRPSESPSQSFASELTNDLRSHASGSGTPPGEQKFVGTPDYLAPETILGIKGDDAAVDWWALGVITYEFLYGIPPFHAETPEKVFENILSGHIEWHEDWIEFSPEARDFMQRLMTVDPSKRLGANGAEEVKAHPFFNGIEWDKVTTTEAAFIPQVTDPESTDYFDPRGAIPQLFQDDDLVAVGDSSSGNTPNESTTGGKPSTLPVPIHHGSRDTGPVSPNSDDFGSFSFKNLPVLKQANDDVIRKLKTDQMAPMTHALSEPGTLHNRSRSISNRVKKPPSVVTSVPSATSPPSPATSMSSIASSPSRVSIPPSTPGSATGSQTHSRKPSEFGTIERFKQHNFIDPERRNSMPSRLRATSISDAGDGSGSEQWHSSGYGSHHPESSTPPSSVYSIDLKKGPDPNDRAVTCLLAEDNPITAKIIETLLIRLGCRCVVVGDGSEAISVAMGDIKFDCILMDLQMPVVDGEGAARYIKTTNGKNRNTPIIAVSAYGGLDETSNHFAAALAKPLQKADLLAVLRQLGFKTSTVQGGPGSKVTTSRIIH